MLKFYEQVKIQDEIYPWQSEYQPLLFIVRQALTRPEIFGKLSYSALSKIYRDMRCQHHLIQEHPAEQPYIPALTPDGFQEWMTAMIQAYPDAEYARMAKAVLDMPISSANDRKERFPKEMTRRMFPATENLQAQQRCAAALSSEGVGPLRKAPTFPPPPPKSQAIPIPNLERERSPYVSQSDPRSFESEGDFASTSVPIERERKPYAATPGGGKTYDEDIHSSTHSAGSAHEHHRRTQSTTGQAPWASSPPDPYQHRNAPAGNARRPRSPSFSSYTQSDPTFRDIPGSYYASNLHDTDADFRRHSKDTDGRRHDRHRRNTAGTDGSFDSQPRSGYDDDDYRGRSNSGYDNSRSYDSRRY